jgi:HAD superfamily hydrolase (TIGR01509 family)
MKIAAVVFDLDGVLIDSESVWDDARREVALEHGGHWTERATQAMIGMSSTEWSAYMHEHLGVALDPPQISDAVVARLRTLYHEQLPLVAGAPETVVSLGEVWPLGLASSANRPIIDLVLELAGLRACFIATVSSEEVQRGKPAPDVYLEVARRLGTAPEHCAAVEDSANGIRSAAAAGMSVIAIPNRVFPPAEDALSLAADVLQSLAQLTPARVRQVAERATGE